VETRRHLLRHEPEPEINLLILQQVLELSLATMRERKRETRNPFAHPVELHWQILTLDDFRSRNTKPVLGPAPQTFADLLDAAEERGDEIKKQHAFAGKLERTPDEKRHPEGILKLQNLGADRRLLYAVGDLTRRGAYSAIPRHIVEQFQMVDVGHSRGWPLSVSSMICQSVSISQPKTEVRQ